MIQHGLPYKGCLIDVTPFAGTVLLRASGESGHCPLLNNVQDFSSLERLMRSIVIVLDSVLLSQQLGLLRRGKQLNILELVHERPVARPCKLMLPR